MFIAQRVLLAVLTHCVSTSDVLSVFLQDVMPVSEFLGPYIPPERLTRAALKGVASKEHGDFAAVISGATIRLRAASGGWQHSTAAQCGDCSMALA